jgi:Mn2+/Fe2+ NRAMP family transporter
MELNLKKRTNFLKVLGPGLLWAGAAIGVSHLVQSTRAGAGYGFALVWVVILANIFKYPFFEYGPRYAAATGESLLVGYKKLGNWAMGLYLILTVATMFAIQAAVTVVTASLLAWLTHGTISTLMWTVIILLACMALLAVGRFAILDKTIKVVIILLTLTTIVALVAAAGKTGFKTPPEAVAPDIWNSSGILFLIALMGWMPSAIDLSVWSSLWTLEKTKQTGYKPTLKESLLDFNIGYVGTALIALCFLSLGALVVFGRGETLSRSGAEFAGQFVGIYTESIGASSKYVIAAAAITTMFSTTLTCLDGFPRVLRSSTELVFPSMKSEKNSRIFYWGWMITIAAGAVILLSILKHGMTFMVDLATTLSFLTAPVLAVINYKVVTGKDMPVEAIPPKWLRILSWAGMVFLTGFGLLFLYVRFFMPG